ncbi:MULTISPECIES: hypothetical protein [Nonomuraea]|uniref:Uncharacterized protein n=1 Tax=Nonomuraea mangrovi TaxID=2316207 RepID=A0ABW4SXK3_9ACTN
MFSITKTIAAVSLAASAMVVPMTLTAQPASAATTATTADVASVDLHTATNTWGRPPRWAKKRRPVIKICIIKNSVIGVGNAKGKVAKGGSRNDNNRVRVC